MTYRDESAGEIPHTVGLVLCQDDLVAAVSYSNGIAFPQKPDKGFIVSRTECTAHSQRPELAIANLDLADIVAVELGNGVRKCCVTKGETAIPPAHQSLQIIRRFLLDEDVSSPGSRNRANRQAR